MNDFFSPVIVLLTLATVCLVAIAVTVIITAAQLHTTLRRLNVLLPDAGLVLVELKRSGRHLRRLLTRTDAAAQHVEQLVNRACTTASGVMERVSNLGQYVRRTWAEPRPHHRNGKGH